MKLSGNFLTVWQITDVVAGAGGLGKAYAEAFVKAG